MSNNINPRTYTQTNTPPTWYKGGGGGFNPSQEFLICGKPFICLTRGGIFYGWWRCWRPVTSPTMLAILATILKP